RRRRAITAARLVLISFIGADYDYRLANRSYGARLAVTAEEVVGRDVRDWLGPEGYAVPTPFMERPLGGERVTFELDWPQRDGRPRVAEIRYLPRRGADGALDGFHEFVQDVTDRRRTEADLARQVAA
ncbi:PAS domain-containing protein, partial [Methylobacterium sp. E-005]|uniref:PAS domain-containing protein n=1 Tax=Methylobacterium sp. E-005 TaxID=2836549 RepID=UPI001FB9C461